MWVRTFLQFQCTGAWRRGKMLGLSREDRSGGDGREQREDRRWPWGGALRALRGRVGTWCHAPQAPPAWWAPLPPHHPPGCQIGDQN